MDRGADSMRLSVRTEVQVKEVRWRSSAEVVGRGMPMTDDLTGSERRERSSGGIVVGVVPPKRERRNRVVQSGVQFHRRLIGGASTLAGSSSAGR